MAAASRRAHQDHAPMHAHLDHALNVVLGEAALVVGDGDLVLDAGGLVLGGHVEDAVGVNVEDDVDLGHTAGCGGDARQLELPEHVVDLGLGTLACEGRDDATVQRVPN